MGTGPVPAVRKLLAKDRAEGRPDRSVRAERGLRLAGGLLHARAGAARGSGQRERRGHRARAPAGRTGRAQIATALHELERRKGKYAVITMCVGGGMGAAGLIERRCAIYGEAHSDEAISRPHRSPDRSRRGRTIRPPPPTVADGGGREGVSRQTDRVRRPLPRRRASAPARSRRPAPCARAASLRTCPGCAARSHRCGSDSDHLGGQLLEAQGHVARGDGHGERQQAPAPPPASTHESATPPARTRTGRRARPASHGARARLLLGHPLRPPARPAGTGSSPRIAPSSATGAATISAAPRPAPSPDAPARARGPRDRAPRGAAAPAGRRGRR
jgi:hypothetical protein